MENFKHKKKEIEFWSVTGEVLSQNKFSETHLSSTGGASHTSVNSVTGINVTTSSPVINSSVVTNHEFWILTDKGKEKAIKLHGHDIPLRVGQKITLISAGEKGKDTGYYSVLVNHNSEQHWFIKKAVDLDKHFKLERVSGVTLISAILLAHFADQALPLWLTGVLVLGFCCYRVYKKITSINKMYSSLDNHLERLAQFAYTNT